MIARLSIQATAVGEALIALAAVLRKGSERAHPFGARDVGVWFALVRKVVLDAATGTAVDERCVYAFLRCLGESTSSSTKRGLGMTASALSAALERIAEFFVSAPGRRAPTPAYGLEPTLLTLQVLLQQEARAVLSATSSGDFALSTSLPAHSEKRLLGACARTATLSERGAS